jgi:hypothetical protein
VGGNDCRGNRIRRRRHFDIDVELRCGKGVQGLLETGDAFSGAKIKSVKFGRGEFSYVQTLPRNSDFGVMNQHRNTIFRHVGISFQVSCAHFDGVRKRSQSVFNGLSVQATVSQNVRSLNVQECLEGLHSTDPNIRKISQRDW